MGASKDEVKSRGEAYEAIVEPLRFASAGSALAARSTAE